MCRAVYYIALLKHEYDERNYTPRTVIEKEVLQVSFENLHPRVVETAKQLFEDGYYRQAILDTYIDLVQAVKQKSMKFELDNSRLMQHVFSKENPVLQVSDDTDEQLGFMWLFSGAVMGIRNPKAHKLIIQSDKQKTLEWLAFASVLHRVLEESELRTFDEGSNIS